MKLTKYEHACVVLEEQGKKLVIDPGNFTATFGDAAHVVGVVVTHIHPDHFDPAHLQLIIDHNPDVKIYTTAEVAEQFRKPNVSVAQAGQTVTLEPFSLRFVGAQHAVIVPYVPRQQNVGVVVQDSFYYPGDSFMLPETPVQTLALPASAPWLKISEAIDFLRAVKPAQCFPTHDALLSDRGRATTNKWIALACEQDSVAFTALQPGQSLAI